MHPKVCRSDESQEYYTPEKCFILELTSKKEDATVSLARARVKPGVTTLWHRLKGVAERYVILAGEGKVELANQAPVPVGPGDVVLIPPGTPQRIANTGQADLVFLCVCDPPFAADCYEELKDPEAESR
jgi:mannose-6-phosphate isomerase-like protein (cupin superfamily)